MSMEITLEALDTEQFIDCADWVHGLRSEVGQRHQRPGGPGSSELLRPLLDQLAILPARLPHQVHTHGVLVESARDIRKAVRMAKAATAASSQKLALPASCRAFMCSQ